AITSLAIDTLLALAAGGACALGVLHLLPDIAGRYGETVARNVLVGMVLLVALGVFACLLPGPRRHVAALLQRCAGLLAPGNRLASAQAFATDVGSFVLGAAALGMIATALSPGAHIAPLELLGVYAVAW